MKGGATRYLKNYEPAGYTNRFLGERGLGDWFFVGGNFGRGRKFLRRWVVGRFLWFEDVLWSVDALVEIGVTEIPEELIQKAETIVHQVRAGFRNRG